ncbi:MAG: hypothetical protein QXO47_02885 [Thermoproteota archaeon]
MLKATDLMFAGTEWAIIARNAGAMKPPNKLPKATAIEAKAGEYDNRNIRVAIGEKANDMTYILFLPNLSAIPPRTNIETIPTAWEAEYAIPSSVSVIPMICSA